MSVPQFRIAFHTTHEGFSNNFSAAECVHQICEAREGRRDGEGERGHKGEVGEEKGREEEDEVYLINFLITSSAPCGQCPS